MDIEQSNPDDAIAAAEADLRRHDRRWTYVYLIVFALVTLILIFVWLERTAGERACKKWLETGEPRLEAITIKMTSHWRSGQVTCNDKEALRYFEDSLSAAVPWTTSSWYYNNCQIVLRFADGTEYRSPGPCMITAEGMQLALPSMPADTGLYSFPEPMPDSWKNVLNALLGPGTVQ